MGILAWAVAQLTSLFGSAFLGRVLTHLERKSDNETEQQRIASLEKVAIGEQSASVVREGMQHKVFWIPWLIASVPLTLWFAWGMLDSLFNGALSDVAELPPQLKEYADIVFANIFYTGAAGIGFETLSAFLKRPK